MGRSHAEQVGWMQVKYGHRRSWTEDRAHSAGIIIALLAWLLWRNNSAPVYSFNRLFALSTVRVLCQEATSHDKSHGTASCNWLRT